MNALTRPPHGGRSLQTGKTLSASPSFMKIQLFSLSQFGYLIVQQSRSIKEFYLPQELDNLGNLPGHNHTYLFTIQNTLLPSLITLPLATDDIRFALVQHTRLIEVAHVSGRVVREVVACRVVVVAYVKALLCRRCDHVVDVSAAALASHVAHEGELALVLSADAGGA